MQEEIWIDVVGYEGKFQVSNLGRVKSLHRFYTSGNGGIHEQPEIIMKGTCDNKGYLRVQLGQKTFKIHRLVAIHFIPNPNNYPQVNHKNCDKKDNRVENLEWCTNSMNQKHAWDNGLQKRTNKNGRKIKMINQKTGEILLFKSIKQASDYFGGCNSYPSIIGKILSKTYGYKTFKGYSIIDF